jgi:hypothetical protein
MPLGLPDLEDDDKPIKVDENRTMTVLGDNDKMVYYMGLLATLLVQLIFLMEKRVRKELLKEKK